MGENVVMTYAAGQVVLVQPHTKGVEIYVLINAEIAKTEPEPRRFFVSKTGETVEDKAAFVATAVMPGMKALHVFELL